MFKSVWMKVAMDAIWAVLIAAWAVGLAYQFESLSMTMGYVALSLAMVTVMFGHRLVLKFAPRRNDRR